MTAGEADPTIAPTRPGFEGLVAAVLAVFLQVLHSREVYARDASPRAALVLVGLAVGLPTLVILVRRRGPARATAITGAALGAWALLSAAQASRPAISLFGEYAQFTGALLVVAVVCIWALGRALDDLGRQWVTNGAVIGLVVTCVAALLQVTVGLSFMGLPLFGGRAVGFFGNPVFLGMLCAGGAAMACRASLGGGRAWPLLAGATAFAGQLSGSRFAVAVILSSAAAGAALGWRMRHPARGAAAAAAVAVGLLLGGAMGVTGATGTARVEGATTSGVTPRIEVWKTGMAAALDRPVLGWGPSRFVEATSPRKSLALARADAPDRLYLDAHNVVVHTATTLGIGGLALLLAWLTLAAQHARGPLAWFATGVFALHLVQPLSIGLTPLAALALGAAATRDVPPIRSRVAPLMGAAALLAGLLLVYADHRLLQAVRNSSVGRAKAAAELMPPWPDPLTVAAVIEDADSGLPTEQRRAASTATRRAAVQRDPAPPVHWIALGRSLSAGGHLQEAEAAFREALARNPWSGSALRHLRDVLRELGRTDDAAAVDSRLALLGRG